MTCVIGNAFLKVILLNKESFDLIGRVVGRVLNCRIGMWFSQVFLCAVWRIRLDFRVKFIHRARTRIFHYCYVNNRILLWNRDLDERVSWTNRTVESYLLIFITHDHLRFIRGICVILSSLLEAINLDEYEPAERLSNTESSRVRRSQETCFSTIQNFYTNQVN